MTKNGERVIFEISNEYLNRYKALYNARFGIELDDKAAHDQLLKLLVLVSETYKPMTEKEYEEVLKDKERISKRRGKNKCKIIKMQY